MIDITGIVVSGLLLGILGYQRLTECHQTRVWVACRLRRLGGRLMRRADRIEYPGMSSYQIRIWRMSRKVQDGYTWQQREEWRLVRPR